MSEPALAAWKLPPIVAAIAVSIVGGFYLGGPGLGMAVGALAAAAIVVMAVRHPPVYPIAPPVAGDFRRHILVLLSSPPGRERAQRRLVLSLASLAKAGIEASARIADEDVVQAAPFYRLCIGDSPSTADTEVRHRAPVTRISA